MTAIAVVLMVSCSHGQYQNVPRTHVAHKTNDAITIDGKATEPAWQASEWSQSFIDIEGTKKPLYDTKVKMLWDMTYLYLLVKLEEPHVWGTLKQRDTVVFYNNDFELFMDPDGDTHNYYEFEMNSLNTQWDLFLTKPYRNHGKVLDNWDIQGLKTAVEVDGTLNDPRDTDKGWTIEMAIPWRVTTEAADHNKPPVNEFWRINFSRVNWQLDLTDGKYARKKDGEGKFLPEYNWVWSPQGVINMHEPEHWGYVFFSDTAPGQTAGFEIPKDEHIKWEMYQQYRNLLQGQEPLQSMKILDTEIPLVLERHSMGWNLWCTSPFTKTNLIIDQDGRFTQSK
ncbi:MAG: carbohydrate-binding family 9-like protein [Allomuricauda sp.]